jgi:hypothetical protein
MIMFTEFKKTAVVAAAIQLTGVFGHGFVLKLTIDGVEYVICHIALLWIPILTCFLSCSYPGANPYVRHPFPAGRVLMDTPDLIQDLHRLFGPTLVVTDPLTMSTAPM